MLRLLEGGTYRLLQELSLGPVPESDPGTGGYHTLTIRDGFAVVLWDDQLTVLSRTGGGLSSGLHLPHTDRLRHRLYRQLHRSGAGEAGR